MIKALFDIELIKSKSYLHGNISDEKLLVLIERVQDTYIQDLISTGLYVHLQNDTLSAKDEELLNTYILPCMLIMLETKALIEFSIEYRNGGVGGITDNNLNPLSGREIEFHTNNKRGELIVMEKLLIKFIMLNLSDFPSYNGVIEGLDGKQSSNFSISAL